MILNITVQKIAILLILGWGLFVSYILWEGDYHSLKGIYLASGGVVFFSFILVALEFLENWLLNTAFVKANKKELSRLQWLAFWIILGWVGIIAMVLWSRNEYNLEGISGTGGMVAIAVLFLLGIDFLIKWISTTEFGKALDKGSDKTANALFTYVFEPLGVFISGVLILAVIVLIGTAVLYALFHFPLQAIAVLLFLILIVLLSR